MTGFITVMDPCKLENYSVDNAIISEVVEYDYDNYDYEMQKVEDLLDRIPEREADMIRLHYMNRKYQTDIGKIFKVSQGDVSYRIKRGIKRIMFLLDFPQISQEDLLRDLGQILPYEEVSKAIPNIKPGNLDFCGDNLYLRVMAGMYLTSSQSVVADILGLFQNSVRYRFIKGRKIIDEACKENRKYYKYKKAFDMVSKNPNILRQLKVQERWQYKFYDSVG